MEIGGEVKIIPTAGCGDCGGKCVFKVHVKDGVIIRIESDDGEEPQYRACARGRAYRQRIYHPDRLIYPLKRVGERGEGKFQRISWEEALDTVAARLKRVKETYGPQAIFFFNAGGSHARLHTGDAILRLLHMFGGCTNWWGEMSAWGSVYAGQATYGTLATGHTRDDLMSSRLIIMWGWSPATAIWSTNTAYSVAKAKEAGAKVIYVDPCYTDSAAVLAHQWIPVRPGTDTAMLVAMAYVMIVEELQDQAFLDRYTVGFDRFRAYVLGQEDGVPKTPAWAEKITGVPQATIADLAREYATTKPAALIPGYAPGRTAAGEQFHRATAILAAMTGNVGIHGGGAAGFERAPVGSQVGPGIPVGRNPVEAGGPSLRGSLDPSLRGLTRVHSSRMWDAILHGKAGGHPADIKLFYVVGANPLNQQPNSNKGVQALKSKSLEFFVIHEHFLNATARFADIILPASMNIERNDFHRPWGSGFYYLYVNKAIEPVGECKSDFEIACELALRLGIHNYSDKTEDEWLQEIIKMAPDTAQDIPDYEEFKRTGIQRIKQAEPVIAFKEQIADPEKNPFPTPSGKIEIYSQRLADIKREDIPAIPKYIQTWESPHDPLIRKYPLQLITMHPKMRIHSSLANLPCLKELYPQQVWLNAQDAQARGIANGDLVRVFNDRGQMVIPVFVTQRIMPGVINISEGGWFDPDEKGVDRGGCPNVLTRDDHSPAGAFAASGSTLVQVERA